MGAFESVEGHRDQLFIEKRQEQVLKRAPNTLLRHWDLPERALRQVWVRFHGLLCGQILSVGARVEHLLNDCDDVGVEE